MTTGLAAGCVQSSGPAAERSTAATADATPPTATPAADGGDAVESRLVDLANAADPAAFADAHGIAYDDGRVTVVVTLREGRTLPTGYGAAATLAAGDTVEASVPVDEVRALAADENVTYVRTPREPNA
ncbi:hypothetical protein K933_07137 [Candidatus Halobonum tyrrellensis G22]|uniref:Uncharacterized protein n=1 Tax=Candidatus Halobonum tyrrellensis G22 TaxID=1324957 RepID=V4GUQ4_9EURY|nr:hypothetical protein K933_07137 [Candidatus Halobonum tyrrellensis G22]